ncbi:MAG TPA: hypothetical protein PLW27_10445, partial [Kiritimatiellia bacterium]|nr:hypothetical protein [Kiritimatiellia bacterium]
VKAGDKLKVRVLSVDKARRRISLSAKTQPAPTGKREGGGGDRRSGPPRGRRDSSGRGGSSGRVSSGGGFTVNPFAGL